MPFFSLGDGPSLPKLNCDEFVKMWFASFKRTDLKLFTKWLESIFMAIMKFAAN